MAGVAPLPIAGPCSAVTIGKHICVLLHGRSVVRYSPTDDTYVTMANLPLPEWYCFDADVAGTTIYALGGISKGVWSREFYAYDTIANTWARLPPMKKRRKSSSARSAYVWLFDASKQCIGAGWAHAANLTIAILLMQYSTEKENADECAFYFINFNLDTSFGVALNWFLLHCSVLLAEALQVLGFYGNPIRTRVWLIQLGVWLVIIIMTKLIIGRVILWFERPINAFANVLFEPLSDFPRLELVLVMIACPVTMNVVQFWVTDNFLKKHDSDVKAADENTPLTIKPHDTYV
ncbi:hypothetical protein SDRG_15709 [Saprolegnia diclina VS20]|uniref:Uncharacterized protein n=1 Tax=Saprolegnia diclina (strain VS20) TaxID=1156394 RepID=T0PZG4_SAPDV|nr:hypothetical protein SDRG_15709 [Saprolegnia diclina VS20]EQC26465.1 hypothetical protein SDRG_15709 [Saprolegnia diclina VS20]|eukprot:XP_008620111.1 hypothetical protein SDRG_15709 [Saprolegnia diclina VS20]